ncbi:MAG: hypothetical protein BWY95_01971 [Bacteroidetes bacterium ADurb.BinA104]|nr:MAG: hypothetical protein BWY95_01971 [Bacteroidetes bacterium ADurb.BinA104]
MLAYLGIVVCRNGGHLLNLFKVIAYSLRLALDTLHNSCYSLVYTTLQVHRIGSCSDILKAYVHNALSENGGRGCTVTGIFAGL